MESIQTIGSGSCTTLAVGDKEIYIEFSIYILVDGKQRLLYKLVQSDIQPLMKSDERITWIRKYYEYYNGGKKINICRDILPLKKPDEIYEIYKKLREYCSIGLVYRKNEWIPISGRIYKKITYKQAKKLLSFEKRFGNNKIIDPTKIEDFLIFDCYSIIALTNHKNFRKSYSYITVSNDAEKWLDKIIS